MAKSKGSRYFSKTINGEPVTMTAHTEADAVRYVYDGWRDITADVEAAQAAAKEAAAAAKPAASDTKPAADTTSKK